MKVRAVIFVLSGVRLAPVVCRCLVARRTVVRFQGKHVILLAAFVTVQEQRHPAERRELARHVAAIKVV